MSEKTYQLRTLSRGLDVLSLIERSTEAMTLTEIAERLDEAPPVIFRILKTLESHGYLQKVEGSKRYAASRTQDRMASARHLIKAMRALSKRRAQSAHDLAASIDEEPNAIEFLLLLMRDAGFTIASSEGLWSLSPQLLGLTNSIVSTDVVAAARPIMERLCERTGETVALFLRAGASQVVIDFAPSRQPLRYIVDVGTVFPVNRGAAGKAALAWLPEREIRAILADPALAAEHVQVGVLIEEFAAVRADGYALSVGERVPGASAVAAPIIGAAGAPLAVINIMFPSMRGSEAKMRQYGDWLTAELRAASLATDPGAADQPSVQRSA